jgi:hypothetical protein
MDLGTLYAQLPKMDDVPVQRFYVPGYTEALRMYKGVRIVLDVSWLTGLEESLKAYFIEAGFPCYFIPICVQHDCYGFVVKSFGKRTPVFCTTFYRPNMEFVTKESVVCMVEGIKDSYILLKAGLTVVPTLASIPSKAVLEFYRDLGCRVVFIPDHDEHEQDFISQFQVKCSKLTPRLGRYSIFTMEGPVGLDFGDFFKPECRLLVLANAKRLVQTVRGLVA